MVAIPLWLKGANVGCVMTPQNVDTAGTLTDTTPVATLTGTLERVSWRSLPKKQEISHMGAAREHDVILKERTEFTLSEILKPTANLIEAAFASAAVFKLVMTRGTTRSFTFYGVRGDYEEGLEEGKSLGVGTLTMVDPGQANPTITGS